MNSIRIHRTVASTGYGGRLNKNKPIAPATNAIRSTFEAEPFLQVDEESALLTRDAATTRNDYVRIICNRQQMALGAACVLCLLAGCAAVIVCATIAMGRIEAGVYSRIDPVLEHLEPTVRSAKHLMANLETKEVMFTQEFNRTYHSVVRALPAVTNTNNMLEDTSKILNSVAHTVAHPRLHIEIDGKPD